MRYWKPARNRIPAVCSLLLWASLAYSSLACAAEPIREKPGYSLLTPDIVLGRITKYDAAGKPSCV